MEEENAYKVLVGDCEGKIALGIHKLRLEDNVN
jgi:hypothetical protein